MDASRDSVRHLRAGGCRWCQSEGGAARAHRSPGAVRTRRESRAIGVAGIQACSLWRCHAAGQAREQWERMVSRAVASLGFAPRMLGASTAIAKGKDYCITGEKKTSCVWRHVVCAFACSYLQRSLAQKRSLKLCPKRSCVCCVCAPAHARAAPYTHTPQSACAEGTRAHPASRAGTSLRRTLPHRCKMPGSIDPLCPATAPFFGFMGAAVALIFASASPPTQPAALARAPASHQRTGGDAPAACGFCAPALDSQQSCAPRA